jgi:hypothetical protein
LTGERYNTYCIDLRKDLTQDVDVLTIDGSIVPYLSSDEAAKVNFIMGTYNATLAADPNVESAAIQAAIWNVITADDPPQFLTDPSTGWWDDAFAPYLVNTEAVRDRALEILGTIPDPVVYPASLVLEPASQSLSSGQVATITAAIHDQYDNPFEFAGIQVNFNVDYGTLNQYSGLTDSNGEVQVELTPDASGDSATVTAWAYGGMGILIQNNDAERQNLVLPNTISGTATVDWEKCYYPQGYTPGFWKNNIGKQIGLVNGKGIQVPLADISNYLQNIKNTYGGTYAFLNLVDPLHPSWTKERVAYSILSVPDNSIMQLKAQKMILSLLLTIEWKGSEYLNGCVDMPNGHDITIADALADILDWYADGNYTDAKNLADWINNQPEGGYGL